jgi:geranyl-CoA carboxylase alpha subunit
MIYRPFSRLLIANRGEIARRIIRSARLLGLHTVAVYSDADRDALHVREADYTVAIGASSPKDSYLNIPNIIAAATASGADGIHPGYGFLAESAAFAQACLDAGLVFVGPPPAAIAAMGNKAGAKQLMRKAGVPCIPGFDDSQDESALVTAANRIGYPVMVKAAAGGGGRGMRRVENAGQLAAALRAARSEAEHAFGNGELILERALDAARHIEIQVFADAHGNCIHLGERDCSVQRRHQKIIEEAPSPAVSPELRGRMGAAAVAAAKSIGYTGAGTVEFLLDRHGEFYFMEMNTRLQVEHAVTEAISGLDLVAMQLQIAAGADLEMKQDDLRFAGHAIEVRLCAEDSCRDFLPQSGTVLLWHAPAGIRVDHALESGAPVPPYYDSMIAKLIAHAETRDLARTRLIAALEDCTLLGIETNRSFLLTCLRHEDFVAGRAATDFVQRNFPAAARVQEGPDTRTLALAALLMHESAGDAAPYSPELRDWASNAAMATPLRFDATGAYRDLSVAPQAAGCFRVSCQGEDFEFSKLIREASQIHFYHAGADHGARYVWDGDNLLLDFAGRTHRLRNVLLDPPRSASETGADGRILAPMNGRVAAIEVAPGAAVAAGQVLLVLEAMKMEHPIVATIAGSVAAIGVAIGEQVAPGRLLMCIDALGASR